MFATKFISSNVCPLIPYAFQVEIDTALSDLEAGDFAELVRIQVLTGCIIHLYCLAQYTSTGITKLLNFWLIISK